jgi:hypothetical protein
VHTGRDLSVKHTWLATDVDTCAERPMQTFTSAGAQTPIYSRLMCTHVRFCWHRSHRAEDPDFAKAVEASGDVLINFMGEYEQYRMGYK